VQVGDRGYLDGMKKFQLNHMTYFPRSITQHFRVDLSCGGPRDIAPLIDAIGDITQFEYCIRCPFELCQNITVLTGFLRSIWQYRALGELPPEWSALLQPFLNYLSQFDVFVMANGSERDNYLYYLARLANPNVLRISDLTARAQLTVSSPAKATRIPIDATIAASLYIAALPYVLSTRVPSYIIPGSVDAELFNVAHVLSRYASPPIASEYCSGAFRKHVCSTRARTNSSRWCDSNTFVFGFLARLAPEKGVGLFMSAAASVAAVLPSARFVMVGRPAQAQYFAGLHELRKLYGLEDVVRSEVDVASRQCAC
jgi:glycosyltransferase involved in cell wall biosynthesis